MASDWVEVNLGDLFEQSNQGVNTTTEKVEYSDDGLIVVRAKNISAYNIDYNDVVNVSEETFNRLKPAVKPKYGDILFTNIGSQLGNAALVKNNSNFVIAWNVFRIVPKIQKVNAKFLESFLNSEETRNLVQGLNASSTMPFISGKVLRNIKLNLPPLQEQKAIAHILGALDDKIELNRQMNETLEAMAEALFKSWFVDFDPVIDNALAAGKPIPDELMDRAEQRQAMLDAGKKNLAIRDLFPDEFEFTEEMGWIPKGWNTSTLDDLTTELRRGISPKYTEIDGVRVVNQRCIRNHSIDYSLCRLNDASLRKVEGRYLELGDVLVNSTGVGTLGRMAQVFYLEEATVVDSHVTVVRPNTEIIKPYTFGRLMLSIEPLVESMGLGSTGQTELRRVHLGELVVCVPTVEIQNFIEKSFASYADKSAFNLKENITLSKLRDTLLPKLLSGELRIRDAEKFVDEVL